MATANDGIDQELLDNGIKDPLTADIEQEYTSSINELNSDPSKENNAKVLQLLYQSFKNASNNDKILRKMYKDLKKKYTDLMKENKSISDTQKEEMRNYELMTQKYNELLKANNQVKEELKQKEKEVNEFTITQQKEETEIDEAVVNELKENNEQLGIELNENKKKYNETIIEYNKIKDQFDRLNRIKNELVNEKSELEKKRAEDAQLAKTDLETKDNEIRHVKELSEKRKKDYDEIDVKYNSTKEELEKRLSDVESISKDVEEVQNKFKKLSLENDNYLKKIDRLNNEKKSIIEKEHEANSLLKKITEEKDRIQKISDQNENTIKEKIRYIDNINKSIGEKNIEIERQKGELTLANKNISGFKREIDEKNSQIKREIHLKNKTIQSIKYEKDLTEKKEQQYLEMNDNYKKALGNLDKIKKEYSELEKVYREMERARNKMTEQNTKLNNKIERLLEDIRLSDNRVQELQKKVAEYEKKMKIQREIYDAVRRDKNLYFKNLIETQDDLVERQNLLQFNKKEIENLKSDLKKKDDYIVDIKGKNAKFEKSLKIKEINNNKLSQDLDDKNKACQSQEKEMEKLKINVEETAKNYSKLENEYKKTIIDRDNLSTQLIRRNDEVSILHEKIMILTTDMSKLEKTIQNKEDLISKHNRDIKNLTRELKINQKFKEKAENLAKELINLNKELLREKNLNKALTEEVESSEKLFHRWRKLEGIDPDSLELHYKIGLLQKRLIQKTEEGVEKEITIQDLTKELANSKKLANKKPLFEIEESIKKYKQELSRQYDRMKAVIAELNMYRNQVEEYKADNNRVKKENIDLQNKYHELKIRSNQMNEMEEA